MTPGSEDFDFEAAESLVWRSSDSGSVGMVVISSLSTTISLSSSSSSSEDSKPRRRAAVWSSSEASLSVSSSASSSGASSSTGSGAGVGAGGAGLLAAFDFAEVGFSTAEVDFFAFLGGVPAVVAAMLSLV